MGSFDDGYVFACVEPEPRSHHGVTYRAGSPVRQCPHVWQAQCLGGPLCGSTRGAGRSPGPGPDVGCAARDGALVGYMIQAHGRPGRRPRPGRREPARSSAYGHRIVICASQPRSEGSLGCLREGTRPCPPLICEPGDANRDSGQEVEPICRVLRKQALAVVARSHRACKTHEARARDKSAVPCWTRFRQSGRACSCMGFLLTPVITSNRTWLPGGDTRAVTGPTRGNTEGHAGAGAGLLNGLHQPSNDDIGGQPQPHLQPRTGNPPKAPGTAWVIAPSGARPICGHTWRRPSPGLRSADRDSTDSEPRTHERRHAQAPCRNVAAYR